MTPDELLAAMGYIYAETLALHRAMLHILGRHRVFIPEMAEREMTAWIEEHQRDLVKEAMAVVRQFYTARPSPPSSPESGPPTPRPSP